jgi:hypothetical protein
MKMEDGAIRLSLDTRKCLKYLLDIADTNDDKYYSDIVKETLSEEVLVEIRNLFWTSKNKLFEEDGW